MPFRTVAATPEELAILSRAFDEAWIAINASRPIEPTAQEAARERLGYVIIGLWKNGSRDLVGTAVSHFTQDGLDAAAAPDAATAAAANGGPEGA